MNKIIAFIGFVFLLWIGRTIFIPLLIAGFLWYLMNAISDYYRRALPYQESTNYKKTLFDWVAYIATLATVCLVGYVFVTQIRPMFSELLAALLPNLGQHLRLLVMLQQLLTTIHLQLSFRQQSMMLVSSF